VPKALKDEKKEEVEVQKELEMVMGCADGRVILLDPECYENKDSKVSYFNM
jgi:hypothetical protein